MQLRQGPVELLKLDADVSGYLTARGLQRGVDVTPRVLHDARLVALERRDRFEHFLHIVAQRVHAAVHGLQSRRRRVHRVQRLAERRDLLAHCLRVARLAIVDGCEGTLQCVLGGLRHAADFLLDGGVEPQREVVAHAIDAHDLFVDDLLQALLQEGLLLLAALRGVLDGGLQPAHVVGDLAVALAHLVRRVKEGAARGVGCVGEGAGDVVVGLVGQVGEVVLDVVDGGFEVLALLFGEGDEVVSDLLLRSLEVVHSASLGESHLVGVFLLDPRNVFRHVRDHRLPLGGDELLLANEETLLQRLHPAQLGSNITFGLVLEQVELLLKALECSVHVLLLAFHARVILLNGLQRGDDADDIGTQVRDMLAPVPFFQATASKIGIAVELLENFVLDDRGFDRGEFAQEILNRFCR